MLVMAQDLQRVSTAAAALAAGAAALLALVPAAAQQGGGHPEMQTVVLIDLVADRGVGCGTIAPWEEELLRIKARELYDKFDPEQVPALQAEARERAAAASCDGVEIARWPEAEREGWETRDLPKYLVAYRAFALMNPPPDAFSAVTERADYGAAVRAIDTRLAALEVSGVEAPGRGTWWDYIDLMDRMLKTRAASGSDDSVDYIEEVARLTEFWLDDTLGES